MEFEEFLYQLSQMTAPEIVELVFSVVLRVVFGIFAIIAARYGYKIYNKENTSMKKRGVATKFTNFKPEYALNDEGQLLPTGKNIDVQAEIQSQRSKCMDRILDKFIEQQMELPQGEPVYGDGTKMYADPKQEYAAALAYAEELRAKYNIPLEDDGKYVEPSTVLDEVASDSEDLKNIIEKNTVKPKTAEELDYEAFLKWKEEKENEKKA